ncbi:aminotransferase class I/II-fold pyridoxal phosphate-dependent enzyme [Dactylosporangium fulvum]|uniref:8-amino-7-oxononanoate synthase n=1 Tax=Dactylosporangium fulvum TaxID=53359 RepID=A0ABY5VRR4_9ACTN|nr:aminotransferase class I/II-fold pyridoxal phosphate-dependent enzyme [Dactylosporangium fulvum]UWP79887.1 aminotransferase class I/II-fold pyridoxal phosphate-dependent enzyme [Dactylosporangium fulvum]
MSTDVNAPPNFVGPRRYRNGEKMLRVSDPVWQAAADNGLIGLRVAGTSNNRLVVSETGHEFVSLCSSAYLGLNFHPKVVAGAVESLRQTGTTGLMVSNTRIRHEVLGRLEDELAELFRARVLTGVSCTALTFGILPLLASGHLAPGGPRVMVFDRFAHLSMAYVKPIVADETTVLTSPHNDLDFLEDVCRKYPSVAYVADGAYSMGGAAALEGLRELQDRYGLFLYLDDSHSLSITGEHGEGFVRSRMDLNPLTIVVSTLHKGFGANGGIAMLGRPEWFDFMQRHAGPVGWSQNMEVPDVGAALASAEIHRSPELGELQRRLQANIDYFDRRLPTSFAGNGLPVRVIRIGDADRAVAASAELFRRGFYSSAVFFPIVPHGEAGLRVMIRADIGEEQLGRFIDNVKELTDAD